MFAPFLTEMGVVYRLIEDQRYGMHQITLVGVALPDPGMTETARE